MLDNMKEATPMNTSRDIRWPTVMGRKCRVQHPAEARSIDSAGGETP